jgi:L-threonylcarbamoyladenylate synthase
LKTSWQVREARRVIEGGGIVAHPTEAVYGLGCDPLNSEAVLRLLEIKQRPLEAGLILVGARYEHVKPFIGKVGKEALARVRKTWPGPHTWLLPASPAVPSWIRGAHDTVALRVTAHPVAAALCDAVGGALVSSSANLHGQRPARSALETSLRLGGDVDFILAGSVGPLSRPTPIRDAASGRVIRPA